jgi:hypothetical protein
MLFTRVAALSSSFAVMALAITQAHAQPAAAPPDTGYPAVVLPADHFKLISPWPTVMTRAPVLHAAVPKTSPITGDPYVAAQNIPLNDPATIALLSVPKDAVASAYSSIVQSALLSQYLNAYGFGSLSTPETRNYPVDKLDSPGVVAQHQGLVESLLAVLPEDQASLNSILANIDSASPNTVQIAALIKSATNRLSTTRLSSPSTDAATLRECVVYKIRNTLGLNAAAYNIGIGSDLLPEVAQNDFPVGVKQHGPGFGVIMAIGRFSDSDDFGTQNLNTIIAYWTKVQNSGAYNSSDLRFLQSFMLPPNPGDGNAARLIFVRQTSQGLVADAHSALNAIALWRKASSALADRLMEAGPKPTSAEVVSILKTADPTWTDALANEVANTIIPLALDKSDGRHGGPPSSSDAYVFLVDQLRTARFYDGPFFEISEGYSLVGQSTLGDIPFRPNLFPLTSYVSLPAAPGSSSWSNAYFGLSASSQNFLQVPPEMADVVTRTALTATDPFRDLVWQMTVSVTPSLNEASSVFASADDLYQAAKLVRLYRSELERQMSARAASVQELSAKLYQDGANQISTWRGGHFGAPEAAFIEAVATGGDGSAIRAGDTIAVLRPLFRFKLAVNLDVNSSTANALVQGAPVSFKLNCRGTLPTTDQQRISIAASPDQVRLNRWLTSLRSYYSAKTVFKGTVDSLSQEPTEAQFFGEKSVTVYLDFTLSNPSTVIPMSATSVGPDLADAEAGLRRVGFVISQGPMGGPDLLFPDLGPLQPGDRCTLQLAH